MSRLWPPPYEIGSLECKPPDTDRQSARRRRASLGADGSCLEHDLERVRVRCGREHVVRGLGLTEREVVRREHRRVEPTALDQLQQRGRRPGVDETRGDRHVERPEPLEVERRALAVHADVRDPSARSDQLGAELECLRYADGLDRDVHAQAVSQGHHPRDRVLAAVVDGDVRAELARLLEPRVGEIDRDDPCRCVQLGRHDGGEPDRARPDDGHGVAGLDAAVQDTHLVGRREDVREEEHLLVAQAFRDLVHRGVRERDARELGLKPVDQMAEDPAAPAGAEAVVALLAEAAASARRDARDEHPVARRDRRDGGADLDDGADGLVAEDRPRRHLGDVALEDVQIGTADRRRVDAHDRVGRIDDRRVGHGIPGSLAWAVVHERLHVDLRVGYDKSSCARDRRHRCADRHGVRVSHSASAIGLPSRGGARTIGP